MRPTFDEDDDDVRRALAAGAPAYLPVNPIEYHGPHLSLENDHHVSVGLARDLHTALTPLHDGAPPRLAHDLGVGVDPVPGPGTIAVSMGEVARRVEGACRWLADNGAKRVVLVTFHGSPLHAVALEAGVSLLRRRGVHAFSPLNLVLEELLDVDASRYADAFSHITDPELRRAIAGGLAQDFHGGFFETSMALHYAPDTVRPCYLDVPPCPSFRASPAAVAAARIAETVGARRLAREVALVGEGLAWFALRPFPGYTGSPHLASAAAGAAFAREIVARYADVGRDVLSGRRRSPRPILGWLPVATLGGRLGGGTSSRASRTSRWCASSS
jgi:creatinine amidohydrolase